MKVVLPNAYTLVSPDLDAELDYQRWGQAFAASQQYESAFADDGAALRLDPERAEVYADRSQQLIALERHESGRKDFEATLDNIPAFAEIYH